MPTTERTRIRAQAKEHAKQIDAVRWAGVPELSDRWGVGAKIIRAIPREKLPYLTLGKSDVRRYDPSDVEAYEQAEKRGAA